MKGLCDRQVWCIFDYLKCLVYLIRYVEEDLKKGLGKEPAQVLSARPMVSCQMFRHLILYV